MRRSLQELAVLGIAKIEALMPAVCTCQVRTCHHGLGFAGLKGKSGGALHLDNGCDRSLAIHLYDGQQLHARTPHFKFAYIFPSLTARHP